MTASGYIYEKNNFISLVDTSAAPEIYHKMMEFIKNCKLSYAMLEAPVIYCEVVEEIWASAVCDKAMGTISFTLKNSSYIVNANLMNTCLKIPDYNSTASPTDDEIRSMLRSMNYNLDSSNLCQIKRKGLRREWSFLCDDFIKAFSGKISNFDAITTTMLELLYCLLNDKYYNFGELVIAEISAKLGSKENRQKNIYYARFIMLMTNKIADELVI